MTVPDHAPVLDPERVGGSAWMQRTGGHLTPGDCVHGAMLAAGQQVRNLLERLFARWIRQHALAELPALPDSSVVRLAEAAAMEQPETLRMHGFRTAAFARALALADGVAVDPELLFVCGLLHDDGLVRSILGEDFTVRSAATARRVIEAAGLAPSTCDQVADGILAHTTIGVNVARDGALGTYTQFGAMVDLTGLRLPSLPRPFVQSVFERYPRGPFKREILARFEEEVRAVPQGRFALAKRVGFAPAVRMAPFPS